MKNSPLTRAALMPILLALPLASASRCSADQITQHRINELAAECLQARMTLSGLKGAPKPGETPATYRARVYGYLQALKVLARELAPIRRVPTLKDGSAANLQLWHRIVAGVVQLSRDSESLVQARPQSDSAPRPELGIKLLHALRTVQAILDGLRNARP